MRFNAGRGRDGLGGGAARGAADAAAHRRRRRGPCGRCLPDEPAWAELGRIDPDRPATASTTSSPAAPVRLSERVIRVTAGNGSMMTGPGTNTYLVGGGAGGEWAVIDPGPAIAAHVDAVLAAAPGPITRIFATHTHTDHSPATVPLQRAHRRDRARPGLAHREWQDGPSRPT